MSGAVTRYVVRWQLADRPNRDHYDTVLISEGYSTVDDIPKIIALARQARTNGDANNIKIIAYLEV